MEHYCIAEFDGVQEFLSHLAHKTGRLRKGHIHTLCMYIHTVHVHAHCTCALCMYTHTISALLIFGVV